MDLVIVFTEGDLGLGRVVNVGPNPEDARDMLYAMLLDRGEEMSLEKIEDAIENSRIIQFINSTTTVEVVGLEVASYV